MVVSTITDLITNHILLLLRHADGEINIQRNELAEKFSCAPSQINYVLETRFSIDKGYLVESKRGGGGYIRIFKIPVDAHSLLMEIIDVQIGRSLSQIEAEKIVQRLLDAGVIKVNQANIMYAAIQRESIPINLPWRDIVRASILRNMVRALLHQSKKEEGE